MDISEVRIKLMDEPGDRLKAFCSITLDDCFVVRDLKIIEGSSGPFVAMPSRKLTAHCRRCGTKNHLRAYYCNQCGAKQEEGRAPKDSDGRAKLYADIAHPINSACREMIQDCVIREYYEELERAKQPGYISRYDDYDFECAVEVPNRQTRVDLRHAEPPVRRPHIGTPNSDAPAAQGPHYRIDSSASETESDDESSSRPRSGGFGAGIFPEE